MTKSRMLGILAIPLALVAATLAPAAVTSPVADAAMRGDLATVKALITRGVSVNTAQGDGMTALHWAAERGDTAMTSVLIAAKAGVNAVTRIGAYTPLHIAARSGHGAVVIALLKAGSDPNGMTESGVTPLHFASASGTVEGIAALVERGADPNVREREWGQTPLVFAADKNRAEAITLLIKLGADPALKTKMVNIQEEAAREQAATRRRNEVLISFEPERHVNDSLRPPQTGADLPVGSLAGGAGGRAGSSAPAPGMTMATLGFAALVPGGAEPAGGGGGGGGGGRGRGGPQPIGPFTTAQIQQAIEEGRKVQMSMDAAKGPVTEVVDTINGGVAGFGSAVGGVGGLTALHHAVRQGSLAAAVALIKGGAPINVTNDVDKTTPLLQAAINGQFDVAMQLVANGADPNLAALSGLTPLYATINTMWAPRSRFPQPQAVQNQRTTHIELMDALLKAGAKTNVRLSSQFWYFAYNNCGNANCGLENLTGTTPFWRAAYALDVEAMKLLVKHGADVALGSTPNAGGRGGRGALPGTPGAQPAGAGVDPLIPMNAAAAGGGGGGGGRGGAPALQLEPAIDSASRAVPAGTGVFPVHAVSGVGYGNGYAGNSHRHAPDAWMASMKYVVEELGADVNARDNGGYTPMHHAAARGDNAMILYLVSKGADVKAVARNGRTTLDMANGPVSRITPIPETIALLDKLGAHNSHRCASC